MCPHFHFWCETRHYHMPISPPDKRQKRRFCLFLYIVDPILLDQPCAGMQFFMVAISECILDGPPPSCQRFSRRGIGFGAAKRRPDPPRNNLADGRIACVLLNSNFAFPILGKLEPGIPNIGSVGSWLRSSNVRFHRRHLPPWPSCEWES